MAPAVLLHIFVSNLSLSLYFVRQSSFKGFGDEEVKRPAAYLGRLYPPWETPPPLYIRDRKLGGPQNHHRRLK